MEVDGAVEQHPMPDSQPTTAALDAADFANTSSLTANPEPTTSRDPFREIAVKVHIRRPDKDSWVYLGRAMVTYEVHGTASRVVVRAASTRKVMTVFDGACDLQAEKRGNFVVIGCVEGARVISWSLNSLNNSETLRLLTIIELACPYCTKTSHDQRPHTKGQRRVERVIKDDRRKRHKRRKEADAMVDLFAKQTLDEEVPPT